MPTNQPPLNSSLHFRLLTVLLFSSLWLAPAQLAFAQGGHEKVSIQTPLSETPVSHSAAEVNGVRIHYVTAGNGPAVILLHGYPETWYDWRKVIPLLSSEFTVIAPDMRGLGDSSRPANGDYTKKAVAEDIYRLAGKLGYRQVYVVGQDMGGPVAIALAAAHPEMVIKLVFIESGISGFGVEEAMDTAHGGSWHFGFFATPKIPEMLTQGREREFLTEWAYRGGYVRHKEVFTDAVIAEYLRHYSAPGGMTAGFEYYRAFPQDAKDNAVMFAKSKLLMPVLAVGADGSFGEFSAKNARNVAVNVQSIIVTDCGHFVNEEQPEELAKQLKRFLAQP